MAIKLYDDLLEREYRLPEFVEQIVIGRNSSQCDLSIPIEEKNKKLAEYVSRVHCMIELNGKCPLVRDLGSKNGTFINGEQVNSKLGTLIENGDIIRFGPYGLEVIIGKRVDSNKTTQEIKK